MFLPRASPEAMVICFPRVSGDVPTILRHTRRDSKFSPRERGCSGVAFEEKNVEEVFPA